MAACGAYLTAAVSQDGDLWTMGKGDDGALGTGLREHTLEPRCMGFNEFFDGSRVVMSSAGSCKAGSCGQFHAAALTEGESLGQPPPPVEPQPLSLLASESFMLHVRLPELAHTVH